MKKTLFLIITLLLASLLVLASCNSDTTIEISEDGYWVINGEKTEYKADADSDTEEGTPGLDYYLLPDGTYGVKAGTACYLETIVIPSTYKGVAVTAILDMAFSIETNHNPCRKLKSVTIPDSVTSIGDSAFYECESLTNVTIPNSVTSIGEEAFYECKSLTSVTIPNSVTSIGKEAFSSCDSLTSVTIGNSITSIGNYAFDGCYSLEYNEYENAYYIGNESNPYLVLACAKSTDITSCTVHANTRFILDNAFENCRSLTSVTIPDSVTSIGEEAFTWCTSLTSVTIPDSVTSIGNYAFACCYSLEYNEYDNAYYLGNEDNPYVVLVKAKTNYITSCTVNDRTRFIHSDAFFSCSSLTSVTIPYSVTSIGSSAFEDCTSLTSVTIPYSVTSIGSSAFEDCTSLTSIKYRGTQAEWNAIFKDTYWNYDTGNYTITYNYDGE